MAPGRRAGWPAQTTKTTGRFVLPDLVAAALLSGRLFTAPVEAHTRVSEYAGNADSRITAAPGRRARGRPWRAT